jgi:uncharacterized membrane protein YraQ (UPF0718 family)
MIPTGPDLMAMVIQVGEFFLEIGPFILFGAAAAAAQVTLLGRKRSAWSGERIIAPVAAIPLGLFSVAAAAARSYLLFRTTGSGNVDEAAREPGVLSRTFKYLDGLIFPFLLSAVLGAALVVLTPTDPLWDLLSPPEPWRLLIAPLVAGIIKPRGGTELPLILAMVAKGLDPAGAIAGIAGAGYLHARSVPLAVLHVAFGVALGGFFWWTGIAG